MVLYEDPEDQIPKIVCRCDNYMAWIQEQRMPLHLHVSRDKNISFDQVRCVLLKFRIKSFANLSGAASCLFVFYQADICISLLFMYLEVALQ